MNEFDITDIGIYLPRKILNLNDVENMFLNYFNNGIKETNGYTIVDYNKSIDISKDIFDFTNDLLSENKAIVYIKKDSKVVAVIGYHGGNK
jgi:hypothetical protein